MGIVDPRESLAFIGNQFVPIAFNGQILTVNNQPQGQVTQKQQLGNEIIYCFQQPFMAAQTGNVIVVLIQIVNPQQAQQLVVSLS